jgi:hypothetical protein
MCSGHCAGLFQTIRDEGVDRQGRGALNFLGGLIRTVDDPTNDEIEVHVGKQPNLTDLFVTADVAPHITIGGVGKTVGIQGTQKFVTASADVQNSAATRMMQMQTNGVGLVPRLGVNKSPGTGARLYVTESGSLGSSGLKQLLDFELLNPFLSGNKADVSGIPALQFIYLHGAMDVSDGATGYALGTAAGIAFLYNFIDSAGGGTIVEDAPLYWDKLNADTAAITDAWAADVKNWTGGFRQRQDDLFNRFAGKTMVGADVNATARQHTYEPTLGNEVHRLESAATNDDPRESVYQGRIATVDATVTTLHTVAIPATTTVQIVAFVTARRTGGAAGTAEDGAGYMVQATVKNVAGAATLIGAVNQICVQEDQAGWDATIDVNGANARVRVNGAVDNNVTWHATVRTFQLSS